MEDLKTMLDKQSITDINQTINKFIHSGDGYENKLKLTFVILNLINESCTLLKTVDVNDYIHDVCKRIEDIENQCGNLNKAYHRHLDSNKDVSVILVDSGDNRMSTLQKEIDKLLAEYDNILKSVLKLREELPVETLIKKQEQR